MAKRWIQHPITLELIPRDEYVRPKEAQHALFDDYQPFVSPIDGSVITGRRAYSEHCRKHNVVNAAELSGEWERAAKRREQHYSGVKTREEQLAIRRQIYETWTQAEREHGQG